MAGKRDKPEEIVLKLRQVEVLQGQHTRRQLGIDDVTAPRRHLCAKVGL